MSTKKLLSIICLLKVIVIMGCSAKANRDDTSKQKESLPFDYNIPNIYVFSIKTTTLNNTPIYLDTLGLMCTNRICNWDSSQRWISWLYLSKSTAGTYINNPGKINNSHTGVLSSKDTLFLHPPRQDKYIILEICPYPCLHFPLYIGKKWDWDLDVGPQYSVNNSLKWDSDVLFRSKYEVTDTTFLKMPTGEVSCYHIYATNTSKFGISSADFYYSYKYGLVKLQYQPLDSTKIEFDLITSFYNPDMFKMVFPNSVSENSLFDNPPAIR